MIKVNITFQIISPESAKRGDYEEQGFQEQDMVFESRDEALKYFSDKFGCYEQGNEDSYYTVDPETDLHTGYETTYGLHF